MMAKIAEVIDLELCVLNGVLSGPTLHEFVRRNWRVMVPASAQIARGPIKECFSNSYRRMTATGERYCEGLAMAPGIPFTIHHALNLSADGRVIDATWRDPVECQYFGVEFSDDVVLSQALSTGRFGLLDQGRGPRLDFMITIDDGMTKYQRK